MDQQAGECTRYFHCLLHRERPEHFCPGPDHSTAPISISDEDQSSPRRLVRYLIVQIEGELWKRPKRHLSLFFSDEEEHHGTPASTVNHNAIFWKQIYLCNHTNFALKVVKTST